MPYFFAALDHRAKLLHSSLAARDATRKIGGFYQLSKARVYPKAVRAVVCEAAEVILGIVIDVVKKLVAPLRRTVGGREEAARNSTPDTRGTQDIAEGKNRALALYHFLLEIIYGAARALGVGGVKSAPVGRDRYYEARLGKSLGKEDSYGVATAERARHPKKFFKVCRRGGDSLAKGGVALGNIRAVGGYLALTGLGGAEALGRALVERALQPFYEFRLGLLVEKVVDTLVLHSKILSGKLLYDLF